jgi:hypothetical protein
MIHLGGDPVLYWILKTILLIILFLSGYAISYWDKKGEHYWHCALPAIIAYSLEYGLRWNRSFDYPHYYQDLTGALFQDYSDPIYLAWVNLVKSVGIDPVIIFVFYSAILIFAFLLVLKEHRDLAFLALPLFMLIPTQADNHIRQYFAFSIIMIGYYYDYKGNTVKGILWYLVGLGIHMSGAFCVAFLQMCKYINIRKIVKSPWVLIGAYLLFYFFWDSKNLEGLATWLGKFNLGDDTRFQGYIDNADYWFTDDSNISDKLGIKSVASKLYFVAMELLRDCGLLYFGFKLIKDDKFLTVPYWAMAFCLFNNVFGGNNEIFSRFSAWVNIFTAFIVSAVVLKYAFSHKVKILVVLLFCYFYLYVGYVRNMTTINLTGYEYIWDR